MFGLANVWSTVDPFFPVRDTESDPRWGWLGLTCLAGQTLTREESLARETSLSVWQSIDNKYTILLSCTSCAKSSNIITIRPKVVDRYLHSPVAHDHTLGSDCCHLWFLWNRSDTGDTILPSGKHRSFWVDWRSQTRVQRRARSGLASPDYLVRSSLAVQNSRRRPDINLNMW